MSGPSSESTPWQGLSLGEPTNLGAEGKQFLRGRPVVQPLQGGTAFPL